MKSIHPILCLWLILSAPVLLLLQAGQKPVKSAPKKREILFKIPIWAGNGTSKPEKPLGIEDLKVISEKSVLKITSLKNPESPMLLFVAFDTVGDINNINQARKGVTQELKTLGSQYWVGLISAQEQISVLQAPTPERELLSQKIEELSQIGKAGLLESIQPIADLTTSILMKTDVRVAVIFITDSDIGNYRADYLNPTVNASDSRDLSRRFAGRALQEKVSRMTATMSKYQAPIFVVHIDPGSDSLNRSYQNGLKQLAEATGGQCFLSKTIGDIEPAIRDAFTWAKGFYLLNFTFEGEKSGYVKVQVTPSNEQVAATAGRLTYPGKLFLSSAP